ncbi:ComEC family protein, partial [Enterobacter kobei]
MGIPALSVCAILAIAPLLWLPELPSRHAVWIMIVGGIVLAARRNMRLKYVGITLLFCVWGVLAAQESVWPMRHLITGAVHAEVAIAATDGATLHQARILSVDGKRWWASTGVTLYGNYLPQKACAGQRWNMTLRLRPAHGELNDGGYDAQRSAFAQHQTLSGRFTRAELVDGRCSLRAQYLASLQTRLSAYRWG